ncbi:MAG: phospholipid carrier-dependent glycosyltransferase [Planctomycetota bacterium]
MTESESSAAAPVASGFPHRRWLLAIVVVQVLLALLFRTGLTGSDDMTAAFGGQRLLSVFDMTQAFTNQPMSMRAGMALPLGLLQLFLPTTTALWVFPLLVSLAIAPLTFLLARQLQLSSQNSLLAAATIALLPATVFNSTVSLTEIPLLALTLFALTRMHIAIAAWDAGERRRAAVAGTICGMTLGCMFAVKVSAFFLGLTIGVYGLALAWRRRSFPVWLGCVVAGGAFVSALEMAMWYRMTENAFYRLDMVKQTMVRVKQQAVAIYGHEGWSEIAANLGRYQRDFFDAEAQFGNVFVLGLFVALLACFRARGQRLFLCVYGAPQLYYFVYILIAGPSVQPRYGLQLLPFIVLGTMLFLQKRQWKRPRWALGITVFLILQAIVLGFDERSNQYRAQNMDVPRHAHAKLLPLMDEADVCVDARSISIFYTLSDFDVPLPNRLFQYPDHKYFKVAFKKMRRLDNIEGIYPWQTTDLENISGFVLLDARLLAWFRARLKFPDNLQQFPQTWLLADQIASDRSDSLNGVVLLATDGTEVAAVPGLFGSEPTWHYRARKSPTWELLDGGRQSADRRALIALGRASTTRPAMRIDPTLRDASGELFLQLEFDAQMEAPTRKQAATIPIVYLFRGDELVASLRMQQLFDEDRPMVVRIPMRIPADIDGIGFALMVRQRIDLTLGTPRLFVQRPDAAARALLDRYDAMGVPDFDVRTLSELMPSQ